MEQHSSIEQRYQKKSQLEHILIRPDTYVGSVEATDQQLWVYNNNQEQFTLKNITYVPALYKIFDEILVNAADNYQRDKSMNTIKVNISQANNTISVWNNGQGIPVQIHKEYNIYVPQLVFGHLLAGENFDDTQKKVVGGRNGYGAKLTNIFSKRFTIETADSHQKKLFKLTWRDNMSAQSAPSIVSYSGEDYTCVTFEPDLERFSMSELDNDIVSLMHKRVYDLAGILQNVKVYLNEKKLPIKSFIQYVEMYLKNYDEKEVPRIYDKSMSTDRWEVIVSISDQQFQQVSFVNSICTTKGGTHVNHVIDQIVEKVLEYIKKKYKNLNIKPFQIKNNLWIFINTLIENPAFDSQTKETLTTKVSQFGSKFELSEKLIKDILKCGVVDQIVMQAKAKEDAKLAKQLAGTKKQRLIGVQKLEDANDAGTRNSELCTLIITEGDSAKSLAMAGIEVIGRDKYGVFPLKGKLLNVRDAPKKTILENQEIQNLIKIMGLQVGKEYQDKKSLRYGSLMIMADQDNDGSHIKGLVINFIHNFWPSLISMNGFLQEFITPIIKATKGQQSYSFFTVQDYKRWAESIQNSKQWKIKYYKGLGTSTDKEAQEYFNKLVDHKLDFEYVDNNDDEAIDLAFNKKKADNRKEWLAKYDPNITVDHTIKQLRYIDFINKELIQFSISDNLRSIPNICDGLKIGQRKILYSCFKKNIKDEIKVAQLAATVALLSSYHHGEQSLAQTIIGMAQNFVGSNNINLLMPQGQFGSRNLGGKEAASPRYIFTYLNKITRYIFPEPDDHLYKYLEDDGQIVEPEWYLPIIPLVLVNGAEGIGTGWSTNIPCYNPREIVKCLINKLNGGEFQDIHPWFKGYQGDIEENPKGGYLVTGKYEIIQEDIIRITELPIQKWTREYKNYLESMMVSNEKSQAEIEDIREYHTSNRVDFNITLIQGSMSKINQTEGILKKFRLQTTLQISNMVLFDKNCRLKRYSNVKEIMQEFYELRLEYYLKRKNYLISRLQRDLEILQNKKKFILEIISDSIQIRGIKRKLLIEELIKRGYTKQSNMTKIQSSKINNKNDKIDDFVNLEDVVQQQDGESNQEGEDDMVVSAKEYDYLLNMNLWALTYEKVEQLKNEFNEKSQELNNLEQIDMQTMWKHDLEEFVKVLDEVEQKEEEERQQNLKKNKKEQNQKQKKKVKKKQNKKNQKQNSEDNNNNNSGSENSEIDGDNQKIHINSSSNISKNKQNNVDIDNLPLRDRINYKLSQENSQNVKQKSEKNSKQILNGFTTSDDEYELGAIGNKRYPKNDIHVKKQNKKIKSNTDYTSDDSQINDNFNSNNNNNKGKSTNNYLTDDSTTSTNSQQLGKNKSKSKKIISQKKIILESDEDDE